MKTIVIGTSGCIGKALYAHYCKEDPALPSLDHKLDSRVRLEDPRFDLLPFQFPEYRWAVIAQSITKVAVCEKERERSYLCNVSGTLRLIEQVVAKGMTPIVFSTDYVFDGKTGDYIESSPTNPLNEFGRQKAEVDARLSQICGENYLHIRLGKVVDRDLHEKSFLGQMADSLAKGQVVKAAYDMQFCPIFLSDVVQGIAGLQMADAKGLFHVCGIENWNRLELVRTLARQLSLKEGLIQSISLDQLGESFARPKRINMNCSKFMDKSGLRPSSIHAYIKSL